jgi:septum formation protein
LLAALGIEFEVVPLDLDERAIAAGLPPAEGALAVARAKAAAAPGGTGAIVLTADTEVVHQGRALGKPRDAEEARAMLLSLRGRPHEVVTAVCLGAGGREQSEAVTTTVIMRDYSPQEVDAYVASGTPFDKAGGYGIQDEPFRPVAAVEGCYCNVVGLPLWTVTGLLAEAGIPSPATPDRAFERCRTCSLRP